MGNHPPSCKGEHVQRAARKGNFYGDTKERKCTRCGCISNIGFALSCGGLPRAGELSVDTSLISLAIRALKTRGSLRCEIRRDELADGEERGRREKGEGRMEESYRILRVGATWSIMISGLGATL